MIIKTDADAIRAYLEDASGLDGGSAEAVYLPADEGEAADLMAQCSGRREPLTLSGGGTGLTGARIPFGGVVLATDSLAWIRDLRVDPDGGGRIVVGPAVTVEQVEEATAAEGLFLPPNPTERSAWMGGTVATNASGSRTFRYGPTRRYVRRLRLVLPGGERLDLPRGRHRAGRDGSFRLPLPSGREIRGRLPRLPMPPVKNASGYHLAPGMDLIDLFIGSEGTLALVTEMELQLLPLPPGVLAGIVFFRAQEEAWRFLRRVREIAYRVRGFGGPAGAVPGPGGPRGPGGESGTPDPRALEYFDTGSLDFMRPHHASIPEEAGAAVYFEQETRPETEEPLMESWQRLAEEEAALLDRSWFALDESDRRAFREFRHALPSGLNEWLSQHGQRKIAGDMAVADAAFDAMMRAYREILGRSGLSWLAFGHLGDNHLHVNILPRDGSEAARAREIYGILVRRITSLGGTVSAEHGLGKIKAGYLAAMYGEQVFRDLLALKRLFDPSLILCRGNMIPAELLAEN